MVCGPCSRQVGQRKHNRAKLGFASREGIQMAVGHAFHTNKLRARAMARLLLTGSMIAGFAGIAHAQTAAAPSADPAAQASAATDATQSQPGSDIVVTGYRKSIEASLTQKRNANAFI